MKKYIGAAFMLLMLPFLTGCADFKSYMKNRGNDLADCFAFAAGTSYGFGARVQVTDYIAVAAGGAFKEKKAGFYGRGKMGYEDKWWAGLPVTQILSFAPSLLLQHSRQKATTGQEITLFLLLFSMTEVRQGYYGEPPVPRFWVLGAGITDILGDECDFVSIYDTKPGGDFWIGCGATLGAVGFDIGFNPVEFIDFLLGWTTLDITGDDFKNIPDVSIKPQGESAP